MRSQEKSVWLVAVALVLLVASSCSGSSPESPPPQLEATPTAETAPSATTAAAPTPVPFDPGRVRVRLEQAGSGFSEPLFVAGAGDGSGRVFVLEKTGRVRLLDGGTFLDIRDRVKSPALQSYDREQGLLGLAFHPQFASNGFFYVHYNDRDGNHVVSRFSLAGDGRADPASEKVLLRQHQPETNFNGGMLAFGRDGFLYIGLGTGGTAPELQENSQNMGSLLGKILRIDVDRGDPYSVPGDNPFVNQSGARPEVWAFGVRNPYRFAFDRGTGDLYIGGPGEFKREWVNFFAGGNAGGRNFGWPILEGDLCRTTPSACSNPAIERPIIAYDSYAQGNCVVIGGYVYRGQRYPALGGVYFYGDYCSGRVWMAGRDRSGDWKHAEAARLDALLSSFGEDDAGEVYVVGIDKGTIYRIVGSSP
jgi:glucose/arabinose dehydrogenase